MKKMNLKYSILIAVTGLLVITQAHTASPIWTYSAPNPATTTISPGGTGTVQYTVTNQSNLSKNLILQTTPGLSASSCYLATKGSTCTLTLTVNGSAVPREGIHTGPVLCAQGNPTQCYKPSQGNELNITLTSRATYTVTASGDAHVTAAPASQNISSGSTGTINLTVATGYTAAIMSDSCNGSLTGTTYTTSAVTASCSVSFSSTPMLTYTNIYTVTYNYSVAYSPDNGTSWGYMLSPQGGWEFVNNAIPNTGASAVTSDGTMYQATGVSGNGTAGNGGVTLIYSLDGIHWTQVASFPTNNDYVQSLYAVGNTVYVGTGNGYVYSTSNQGSSWQSGTTQVPDGSTVNAIVVDDSGNYYAGTNNGNVYYSTSSGVSWGLLTNQPAGGGGIESLAIDTAGTLYAITANTTIQPQYNSAPLTTGTWQTMAALPALNGNALSIAATGNVVYVGTDNSYVMYTSDKGTSWNGNKVPNDSAGVLSLFVNQSTSLSPLFVESYGTIQINGSSNTSSVSVTNFSNTTRSNVQANSSQLPTGITSSSCATVASGASCTITLTAAAGAQVFAPTTFDIIDSSNTVISRAALVASITPNGGVDYYYVYNVNGTTSYVLDNSDASNGVIWSSDGSGNYDNGVAIYGISEISTTLSPNPSSGHIMGQTACNGPIDGSCNSNNTQIQYSAIPTSFYAEGVCYQSTNGAASSGDWYLPSSCELTGGIYLNLTTNNFSSCSSVLTGIVSLYNLGALGGDLQGFLSTSNGYWSSTEVSSDPQRLVWGLNAYPGGGSSPQYFFGKAGAALVRCVRAI